MTTDPTHEPTLEAEDALAWKRQDRRYHEQPSVASSYDRRVARYYRLDHRRYTLEPWARRMHARGVERVLDFGCGTGVASLRLRALGFDRVVSTDASLTMLAVVRAKARQDGTGALLVAADGDQLPFRPEVFDAVVCLGVLHHMPEPSGGTREQCRVLARGGLLFASEPHAHPSWLSYPGHLLFALARTVRDRVRGAQAETGAGARERPLDRDDVARITGVLAREGLTYNVSRFTYWPYVCGVLPDALAWPLMRLLDRLKPDDRGDAIRFEAHKPSGGGP